MALSTVESWLIYNVTMVVVVLSTVDSHLMNDVKSWLIYNAIVVLDVYSK